MSFGGARTPRFRTGSGPISAAVMNQVFEGGAFASEKRREFETAIAKVFSHSVIIASHFGYLTSATPRDGLFHQWVYTSSGRFISGAADLTEANTAQYELDEVYNLGEIANSEFWIYPGIRVDLFPEGWEVLPVGGRFGNEYLGAPAHIFTSRRTNGDLFHWFIESCPYDGECPEEPLSLDGGVSSRSDTLQIRAGIGTPPSPGELFEREPYWDGERLWTSRDGVTVERLDKPIPVGGILITESSDDPADVEGYGEWQLVGSGRVLVGQDENDASFDTIGEEGGSKTHLIQPNELPHGH